MGSIIDNNNYEYHILSQKYIAKCKELDDYKSKVAEFMIDIVSCRLSLIEIISQIKEQYPDAYNTAYMRSREDV